MNPSGPRLGIPERKNRKQRKESFPQIRIKTFTSEGPQIRINLIKMAHKIQGENFLQRFSDVLSQVNEFLELKGSSTCQKKNQGEKAGHCNRMTLTLASDTLFSRQQNKDFNVLKKIILNLGFFRQILNQI